MKKIMLAVWLGITVLIGGCVVTSVSPFYTDKDLVFDPALIGQWMDADSKDKSKKVFEFKKTGDQEYLMSVRENSEARDNYVVHLFKLNGQLFLDLFPTERHEDFVPVHQLMKVTQIEPSLQLAGLKYKGLEELLEKSPDAIRHEKFKEKNESRDTSYRIVLTASTKELQDFILKHIDNKDSWDDRTELKRKDSKKEK